MAKRAIWGVVAGAVAATALAATVALAVPAAAQTAGQAVAVGQSAATGDRAAACDKLKKADQKRQAVAARLSGDANTRGSIAWLNAKAATATAAGDTNLAKLYTDKAALRTQLLQPMKTVEADLAAVIQANCS